MSLKTFHIIFIVCSIVLAVVFGCWAINNFKVHQSYGYLFAGIGAFLTAFGLIIYETAVIRKIKD